MQAVAQWKRADRKRRVTVSLLALFFLASAFLQYKMRFTDVGKVTLGGLKEKTPAPSFSLSDLKGEGVSLEAFHGKILIMNFWATWCSPCRAELADLRSWWEKHRNELPDLMIVAVNFREDASVVHPFVEQMKLPFMVLLDSEGSIAKRYDVKALPTLYVIDREGIIVDTTIGYAGNLGPALDYALRRISQGMKR